MPALARTLALAALAALAVPAVARADDPVHGDPVFHARPRPRKAIDLVLCLDTSGSMQGLIDSARKKLWQVVNECARARPAPDLRVALLTYGSPGDEAAGYVVMQTPFTRDLDLVSERLFALSTSGGDEYVGRVVKTAVDRLEWGGPDAAKILFVAGNESADQDTVAPFRRVVPHTSGLGIRVNSIYCGNADDPDAAGWRDVASLGLGRFAVIDKDHGVVAISTPYDKELAELSGRVNGTYVAFGRAAEEGLARQKAQDANAAGAAPAAAAERAASKASGIYPNSTWDLVDKSAEAGFDLAKVADEDLPEEMRKMTLEQRKAHLEGKRAERTKIQARIQELSTSRSQYVKDEMAKQGLDDGKALDRAIRDAVRAQAAEKGFTFE
jgi:hypothetical protein